MRRRRITGFVAAAAMCILILDTKTAVFGVTKGITVCIETMIPSLFPFLIVSKLLSGNLSGRQIPFLRPFAHVCGIPEGFESILAIGFLGGYPIGASIIGSAYRNQNLDRKTASRLLCFCNNAGPSFIFGMSVFLFDTILAGWSIWFIQIAAAIIVGIVLPGKSRTTYFDRSNRQVAIVDSLDSGIRTMGSICAWVIVFRVMITYLEKWFGRFPNGTLRTILVGVLELSNGCIYLNDIPSQAVRFVIFNALLSFGGICVLMQTQSAARGLEMSKYIQGKILQCEISTLLAVIFQKIIFPNDELSNAVSIVISCLGLVIFQSILLNRKKTVASRRKLLYNQ